MKNVRNIFTAMVLTASLLVLSAGHSFAAIEANKGLISADIAAATVAGVDAKTAAYNAVSKAVEQAFTDAKANNPDFAANLEEISLDIMVAYGSLDIPGLDPQEVFVAAREGLMAGAGLEDAAIIGNGIQASVGTVKEVVCLRMGKTLDECPVDLTPALEAYETPAGEAVPALEAYQGGGPSAIALMRRATREPPAWGRHKKDVSRP